MPKIDFYVLTESGAQVQYRYACRLAEKAYDAGHRVYVRTANPAEAAALDELMWTFSDRSFLPHELVSASGPTHKTVAILIGHEAAPRDYRSLLINLAEDCPAEAGECERVAEIVDGDPQRKRLARDRFRYYREQGWQPETHNI